MSGFQIMQDQGSQSSPYKSKDAEITRKLRFVMLIFIVKTDYCAEIKAQDTQTEASPLLSSTKPL